jgi:transposase
MEWTVAIGVDTHKRTHSAVALDRVGTQIASCEIEATSSGYARPLSWASELGEPAFALEGAGSYGSGLASLLVAVGLPVYEVERPRRRDRRRGKNDLIDAARAAERLLSGDGLSALSGGGPARQELRLNQVHSIVLTAPTRLRERLDGLTSDQLTDRCRRLRPRDQTERVLVSVLNRLTARARQLTRDLAQPESELERIVTTLVPDLLAQPGIGPVCAAQLVVSSGDPERMRNEASFAALAGTSPVEASSGPNRRHRLNRGGDRQLNAART